ncbi:MULTISPECIES: DMT family transporter [unclassified Streptomyces]|uniref:DMT family transporter n=1 Tax=unclassified Streptomyces TaxID=2593676 RepID=UPI001F038C03|nr:MULTISPECIES: DMT family transporter [unclassified Streptomyces]MCH0564566.1 DMT family transporter [Streptomyces sp. MUM 2J]MCH0572273.1 DMT family transporter [Streptomyces sp. MUM 136J]
MSALALSVLLSLVSAVAYAAGAIVQEQVALSSPGAQFAPVRRPAWWAAVALNGLGGLLHVLALAYGPLSLVQPLGALTIVFALPMAALFVRRRAGAAAWRGAVMATVGLAGLLSLVGAAGAQSLSASQRVGAALATGAAVAALMAAGRAAHRHPAVRSVLLAAASGIAFGMASVFTKTVAVDWTGGAAVADVPSLAVIGVFASAGVLLSQASYRDGGLAAPLATLTVVNPVVAAAVGITMFGETFRHGTTGTVLALGCGVVAAGGLILLTTERIQRTPAPGTRPSPAGVPVAAAPGGLPPTPGDAALAGAEGPPAVGGEPAAPERRAGLSLTAAAAQAGPGGQPALPAVPRQPATAPDEETPVPAAAQTPGPPPPSAPDRPSPSGNPRSAGHDDAPPALVFGPFYGAPFVAVAVLDRHRTRVKS